MKKLYVLLLLFVSSFSFGQTWSDNVAAIFYNKCATCHHQGGIAPFSLMSFNEASSMLSSIETSVNDDVMPPWPPDNNYQQYSHSRSLSPSEKATVLAWIANGGQEGNTANTPPPPVFNTGSILGSGDLTVQIPTYMSKAQTSDDYVCFSLPSTVTQNRIIRAIEIIPGNREIVHHCLVYVDPSGTYVGDTVGGDCGGPQNATLIGGYTPGASPLVFPSGSSLKFGMQLPANSNIVLAMHYPTGSYGQHDSTKVIFHFYPTTETGIREVFAAPVLQNWSLVIPANQVSSFTARYPAGSGTIPTSYSLLSVFPHMHLLGQSMKVYGIDPLGDSVHLAKINQWDFHWQDFYFFKHMQKIPAGSYLKAEAVYDNTTNNPENPNNPPQLVTAGEGTSDEMFLVYFHFAAYMTGDENIDMEGLLSLGLSTDEIKSDWNIYPNPFSTSINIEANQFKMGDQVSIYVYDALGRIVYKLAENEMMSSATHFEWNGKNNDGTSVESGTYYLSISKNGITSMQPVIKK